MNTYTVIYNSPEGRNEFEVHRAGCRDVPGKSEGAASVYDRTAKSPLSVVQAEVDLFESQDQGWSHEHFHIFPCAESKAS